MIVGVVGGGQLARMMIPPAINLGIDIRVMSESANSSARLATTLVADHTALDDLIGFSETVDFLTFDHEHVPLTLVQNLEDRGVKVGPNSSSLALVQNKIVMRQKLKELGIPQPRWCVVENGSQADSAFEKLGGLPVVAKLPVGGYDGKGVRVIGSREELNDWLDLGPLLLEENVNFSRELSQLGARSRSGEWKTWPPVETRQIEGVCSEVIAPAPEISESVSVEAEQIAYSIATSIRTVGVQCVELFELSNGNLLVNELAMRPHNSGHVFTELSVTSQFEQHLRAVTDMPLGSTRLLQDFGVMVNVFGGLDENLVRAALELHPEAKIHSYSKAPRPGRKAGHVVVVSQDFRTANQIAIAAGKILSQHRYDE